MNDHLFVTRMKHFALKGFNYFDGKGFAERLERRARANDGRHRCGECANLFGQSPGFWRCRNPERANLDAGERASLEGTFIYTLRQCKGLTNVVPLVDHQKKPKKCEQEASVAQYFAQVFDITKGKNEMSN